MDLNKSVLVSWNDFRQGIRGTKVIEDKTQYEVLKYFEKVGYIEITFETELDCQGVN